MTSRPRQPRRPALPRPHLPQGRRARRPARRPRPAAHAGPPRPGRPASGTRSAGTRRSTWSPTASPRRSTGTAATRSASTSATPTPTRSASPTHGIAMVKSLRTRNRFSASIVDQLPHQLVASLLFGHQLLIPIPDIDRTSYFLVFGANPMASNGSLMTVPDFPQRLRDLQARGGRMVVRRPAPHRDRQGRRRAPLRPPRHRRGGAAGDAPRAVRGGADPPGVVRRRGRAGPRRGRRLLPRARRARQRRPGRRRSAGSPASSPRPTAGWRTAGSGCRPRGSARSASGPSHCLNMLTGNLDREGGALFTEPAIDFVTTRLIGRGHHDLYRSRVRGAPEFGGELPVSVFAEEIETPGEGQVRAVLTIAGNPVLSTPDGKRLGAAFDVARLHGGGRHLRQRDDPARRRDPAAHHDPRAGPLRPRLPRARGPEHRAVHRRRSFDKPRGRPPRLGDLPRPDRSGSPSGSTGGRRCARRLRQRLRLAPSPTFAIGMLLRRGRRTTITDAAAHPGGRRPRPAAARRCPAGCRRRTSGSTSPRQLVLDDLDRLRSDAGRAGRRRAGADRPPPPARQQLLDAQRRRG